MRMVALGASIIIALQILIRLITGSSFCLNAGCQVVESLTTISPLYLDLAGLIFFLVVFWLLFNQKPKSIYNIDLIGMTLVSGLVFDATLIAYQVFVAHIFCSYCLIIFALVILLTVLYGLRQVTIGIAILSAVGLSFSILTFFEK